MHLICTTLEYYCYALKEHSSVSTIIQGETLAWLHFSTTAYGQHRPTLHVIEISRFGRALAPQRMAKLKFAVARSRLVAILGRVQCPTRRDIGFM